MNFLVVGDVVASAGCDILRKKLPLLKKQFDIDVTVVNGENSDEGIGVSKFSAQHIFDSGADVITGGNHSFKKSAVYDFYENNPFFLRPANYPSSAPGSGYCFLDKGAYTVGVINLCGTAFMSPLECPFKTVDRLIEQAKSDRCDFIIVDFHAEATSEKKAMGYYLDSKVTAVFGTHTHVQTADGQILPNGTAYITDLGMTGPLNSVLGVKPEKSIAWLKERLPVKFETATGECMINGCVISADKKTGLATGIKTFNL